jgi:DNA-binding MarR family transcriptional regulator
MPFERYDSRISVQRPAQARRLDLDRFVPFFLVAISNKLTTSASRALLKEHDCGVTEWRILAILAVEPEVPPGRIIQVVGIDKSSVSRALKTLQARGCVEIGTDPAHRRRQVLSLTREGRALHDRIVDRMLMREALLLTGFSDEERDRLIGDLKRLLANVQHVIAWEAERAGEPPEAETDEADPLA